ncbi:MAG: SMP-30/gluconolactonase/LRE family protein [Zoogloeaceae bacterium]|jgi:gluconolactonase|nr:SMP-30/gluconolactonase/LRE family protein [Zoogloeaceae bacterium]
MSPDLKTPQWIAALLFLAVQPLLAQTAPTAIEKDIPGVVRAGTHIEFIKEGFEGTEGPLGLPDGSLIFTETRANRITHIAANGSASSYLEQSNGSNGLGFTAGGELVSVQTLAPKVGIIAPPGQVRTLAEQYQGLPFGRPNDLVVGLKAGIFFTDPGIEQKAGDPPRAKPGVYRIANNKLERIIEGIERPNGIQLSPDESVLYIANTQGEHVLAYALGSDGKIGARRDFARLKGWSKGNNGAFSSGADGLAIDGEGRLYVASNAGIEIFNAQGKALGIISLPHKPQNLAFAGSDKKTLYIVGRGAAYRIRLDAAGFAGRAK